MKELFETRKDWQLETEGSNWELKKLPSLTPYQELQIRLKNSTPFTLTLDVHFLASDKRELMISFDILPKTEVTVPISFAYFNSQQLFPPRSNGRLRMMVNGLPLAKESVENIMISSRPCHRKRVVSAISVYLSDSLTEGMIHEPKPLIDHFGQWQGKDWIGKVYDEDQLKKQLDEKMERTEGQKEMPYTSGFFHLRKENEKWLLLDPNNQPFCSMGMDCVGPSVECRVDPIRPLVPEVDQKLNKINHVKRNLQLVFGDEWYEKWQQLIAGYLKDWGINTIGAWSDLDFIKKAQIPYVIILDSVSDRPFPETDVKIFRDFPDVFSAEYEKNAQDYAKTIWPYREDALLIGYFMRNEPQWAFEYEIDLATELLKMIEMSATKQALITFLEKRYETLFSFCEKWHLEGSSIHSIIEQTHSVEKLSERALADLKDFSKEMIFQYVKVPAQAIRDLDPNHLNLGMRYAYLANEAMAAGSEFFDVFSINCYQEDPTDKIDQVAKITGLPVMIGEFHFGALDKGLTATGIKGCMTQKDRAQAFDYYFAKASEHPNFIGAHYFALYDQSCLGRFDGENYQFGFLDVCSLPYQELVENIKMDTQKLLEIHETGKTTVANAVMIPPIFC